MNLNKGYTYMHEHMFIDLSAVKNDDDCRLDCTDEIIAELKECYKLGLRNIVEVSNRGMGRNIDAILKIQKETGINIIVSTGYYKEPFLPEEVGNMDEDELAKIMISEIEIGIEGKCKASVIGEIGTSKDEFKTEELKLFNAATIAHKKTNAPIYTHTTLGTLAKQQADYFVANGVNLKKVVIGHIDLCKDLEVIKSVLNTGVYVGFDTVGKNNYFPDDKRIDFLIEIEKLNKIDQIMLSEDLTRKSHLKYKGGIGYSYLIEEFIPLALERGLSQKSIDMMLIDNPMRLFNGE